MMLFYMLNVSDNDDGNGEYVTSGFCSRKLTNEHEFRPIFCFQCKITKFFAMSFVWL